ncbi:MAG: hypothetical protein ACREBG_06005 [Pyrinomonadaceae bacterium]
MSRHPWYTLSGLVSRFVFRLARNAAAHPNSDLWIPLAFAYGLVEVGGIFRVIRQVALLMLRSQFRRKHDSTKPKA